MATRPWRVTFAALSFGIVAWVWMLGGALLFIRWTALDHPGPPLKELFPYGEMRIGIDGNNPPFAVATANDLFGLDIDLGNALSERLGVPVRFVNMGYDGLYDSIKTDQVDLVISELLIDPSRAGDVFYTIPYFNAGLMLVTKADSPIKIMSDMSGQSLAYEFGSEADQTAHTWLRRIAPFSIQPYELPEYALDAVRLGKSEAALVDAVSVRLYLREHSNWQARYSYVTDILYAIPIRIDRGKTWEAVNVALQSLIDDGTVAEIIDRWL